MPIGAINPIDDPLVFDVVEIGGTVSPGKCVVTGFKRPHEFDVKKGKGAIGGTLTFVQKPPADGTITFWLWTSDHWAQWATFLPLLKYDPTKKTVQAVDIYHPSLDAIDVTSVVCNEIGQPEQVNDGDSLYTITCKFIEFFPAPAISAVSSPNTSKSGGTDANGNNTTPGAQPPNAQDEYQQQISDLLTQAQQP